MLGGDWNSIAPRMAANRKKPIKASRKMDCWPIGMPVSNPTCARMPLPVTFSPMTAALRVGDVTTTHSKDSSCLGLTSVKGPVQPTSPTELYMLGTYLSAHPSAVCEAETLKVLNITVIPPLL